MTSFNERQKCLYTQLKKAEEQCGFSKSNKKTEPDDYGSIDRRTYRKLKHEMKQFRGRESIYKRSEANIYECLRAKTIPDHIKNPNKWVYYSLADVTQDQMSDATNTATALTLIRQLEEKEAEESAMACDYDDSSVFKKPMFSAASTVKKLPQNSIEQKAIFKASKVIMPEYVVGVTKKTENKNVLKKKAPKKCEKNLELKLDHLFEDDE